MQLGDLVDLELLCLEDEARSTEELHRRDRAIRTGELAPVADSDRSGLLVGWLKNRNPEVSTGERIDRSIRTLRGVMLALGLLVGIGTASTLFHYDGQTPINVIHALAVFVGLQLFLLILTLVGINFKSAAQVVPGITTLPRLLRALVLSTGKAGEWLAGRIPDEHGATLRRGLDRMRQATGWYHLSRVRDTTARRDLMYGAVERWTLLELLQIFALAFNVSAFFYLVYRVAFSDLAFGWSTTLDIDPQSFMQTIDTIASPWKWALPGAVPDLNLIAKTRYFRLDEQFIGEGGARGADPVLVGAWWRFLVTAIFVYGLFPRLIILMLCRLRQRMLLSNVPVGIATIDALLDRMTRPVVTTQADEPEREEGVQTSVRSRREMPAVKGLTATTVVWGGDWLDLERARERVDAAIGWSLERVFKAGEDLETEQTTIGQLNPGDAVLIAVDPWEEPDRAFKTFVSQVRERIGDAPMIVGLFIRYEDPADRRLGWSVGLDALGDPNLRVETIEGAR